MYGEIKSLNYRYAKHNYAGNGSNVVNDLDDSKLGLYFTVTDMLIQGFLGRSTLIYPPFATKLQW
jgi:hypothetical protein